MKRNSTALAEIHVENHLMFAEHNMPCAICLTKPAVFDCQREFFSPCWECQEKGWRTQKRFSLHAKWRGT